MGQRIGVENPALFGLEQCTDLAQASFEAA